MNISEHQISWCEQSGPRHYSGVPRARDGVELLFDTLVALVEVPKLGPLVKLSDRFALQMFDDPYPPVHHKKMFE